MQLIGVTVTFGVHAFLREHRDEIIRSWEALVAGEPRRVELVGLALRDHLPSFLGELADWLERGEPPGHAKVGGESLKHVLQRLDEGLDLAQVLREYRLLREAIQRVLLGEEEAEQGRAGGSGEPGRIARVKELARLNAGLDVALSDSIAHFVAERDRRAFGLMQFEHRYTALFETSPDAIFVHRGGRVVLANEACAKLLGARAPADLVGRTPFELFHPDCHELIRSRIAQVLNGERPPLVDERIVRLDGEVRDVEAAAAPFRDVEVSGVQVILRDVTDRKRERDAVRASEGRFRTVIENSRDGITMLDLRSGQYVFLSPAQIAMTGFTEAELRDMTPEAVHDRIHPEDREISVKQQKDIVAGLEADSTVEYRWQVKSGEYRWFSDSRSVVRDDQGHAVAVVGVSRDITDRKRAEEALRQAVERYERQVRLFDGVASTTPDFVYLFDLQGRFLYANRRLLEVWGMQLPEVIGKTCRELGYEQWHHDMHMREIAQVIETKRPIKGEVPFKAPLTGVFGVYEYIFTPVIGPDGGVETIAGTTRDVTQRKHAEEALREADRRKTEFLAVLSHELRNPLAPIRNALQILDRAEPGGEQVARAKNVIHRQTEHLTRLVDDLLDATRISSGKIDLHRECFDLRDAVRRTCDDHRLLFEQRAVDLRLEVPAGPVWVYGDPTRISQVVSNLLLNAAKFTGLNGTVTVSIDSTESGSSLRVRDDGIGMEQAMVDRVFEPFVQGEQGRARTQGGLGLGLALVNGLVVLHGGSVSATSGGPGQGSEFVVKLPLAAPPVNDGARAAPSTVSPRRVLIVEDNEDAAQTLAELLELKGHHARVARDGRSGIALAHDLKPEVILCDIGLPDIDGYEVARALRADGCLPSTRLIALSGYAQPEDRRRAMEAGFDAHLSKPPLLDELNELLAEGAKDEQ